MTLMWVVGGLVVGFLVFLMIRRRVRAAEKISKLHGKTVRCPQCGEPLDASTHYVRSGPRGDFIKCHHCGNVSGWDFDLDPPRLKVK